MQAYKRLKTDKKLVVAGGASHSKEYEKFLKTLVEDNKGIIFTGHVEGRELSELFSNAYTYVLPSEVEGMPIALLEAMSYGQCVIASDINENLEVLEDKGFSFISGDIESLYDILAYTDAHPQEVAAQKMMAEQYILSQYDWDRISYETEEIYKGVLKDKV
ncbi:glycosyltransferase family 4 protein [Ruminiclostridium josui]|uniref:glycosyltransferase family 4 protein n=1 Tax=Ruminiclostridium josui TaxID=1499 RepID=UPI001FA76306|nr:glycosyltransferase [Ruminiclostridium josui]